MAARSRTRSRRSSHPPLWLVEGLDIVQRKVVPLGVTMAVVVLGATLVAWLAPGVLPPTALVGAAVGLAALLLGLAAAVATDASDLTVRGPRHVAAAGGELVAVLPREPSVAAAGPLASAIIEVREPGSPLLLAFATAGRDARRASAWTQAIARALVAEGSGVLRVDLASGRSEQAGLLEVVRDGRRLAEVVSYEPGVKLAELAAGQDHAAALAGLTELPARLPRDLDILLVALPTATSRAVVTAASALDHVLVVAERDRTSRVDLIASLEALSSAGTQAQVVLLDTPTAIRLAPPMVTDPDAEASQRRGIASIVGTAPVVAAGSDGQPVSVPDEVPDEVSDEELVEGLDQEPVADGAAEDLAAGDVADEHDLVMEVDRVDDVEVASDRAGDFEATREPAVSGVSKGADAEVARDPAVGGASEDADGEVAPDADVDDVDPRDTAVLTAAAAATALSIADAERVRAGEPPHQQGPDAETPADTGAATADAPADTSADALTEPARTDSDRVDAGEELPVAGDEPRIEGVVQLEFDGDVRPEEVETPQGHTAAEPDADATDRLPRIAPVDPAAQDPGHAAQPDPFGTVDEDLLHTTARLTILTQDVVERDAVERDHLDAGDADGTDPTDADGTDPTAPERTDTTDDERGRDAGA